MMANIPKKNNVTVFQIIRMIELLLHSNRNIGIGNIAYELGVDPVTIHRDLRLLRYGGFDIHSRKRSGIVLSNNIDKKDFRKQKLFLLKFTGVMT